MSYDSGMTLVQLNAVTAERDALRAELAALKAQEPVAWTLTETVQKRETTHGAPLWFSNPGNTAWTPLYAAPTAQPEQAAPVIHNDSSGAEVIHNAAAPVSAEDAPFRPDWVNYRQGMADGKAACAEDARDAMRYRAIRLDHEGELLPDIGMYAGRALDDYIDAALAAKGAQP
jgi:hypothetical protein